MQVLQVNQPNSIHKQHQYLRDAYNPRHPKCHRIFNLSCHKHDKQCNFWKRDSDRESRCCRGHKFSRYHSEQFGADWTPVNGVYNNSVAVVNSKVWYGKGTTTSGQVAFYPTTTGTSSGTALFSTLLNVQANAVIASTSGSTCPSTSINAATTTAVTINCIITNSQNAVANGTVVYCTITGY